MRWPHIRIVTAYFDCYLTGWNRLLIRIGRLRLVLGRRTRSRIPVRSYWLPRATAH